MADAKVKSLITTFFDALTTGNLGNLRSVLAEDVILAFGPYRFESADAVERWASEFKRMFPLLGVKETSLKISGNEILHEFILGVIGPNKVKGRLPCLGKYSIKDGKIHQVMIKPLEGILEITFGDVMRLMLI